MRWCKVESELQQRVCTSRRSGHTGVMGKGSVDRRLFLGAGASLTALTVSGCGFNGGSSSETSESDGDADSSGPSGSIRFAHGSTIDSLDPHYVNQAMIVVPSGLLEGLVLANEDNTDVVPGAAESWEMSEDGTVYTFTMRSGAVRSEEHTSELQSRGHLVCRLLLEKKKKKNRQTIKARSSQQA